MNSNLLIDKKVKSRTNYPEFAADVFILMGELVMSSNEMGILDEQ